MPQSSQQESRSSAEISTEIWPLLWIHNLSDIASAAPKAWETFQKGTPLLLMTSSWPLYSLFFVTSAKEVILSLFVCYQDLANTADQVSKRFGGIDPENGTNPGFFFSPHFPNSSREYFMELDEIWQNLWVCEIWCRLIEFKATDRA